jgi:hypothetical protein
MVVSFVLHSVVHKKGEEGRREIEQKRGLQYHVNTDSIKCFIWRGKKNSRKCRKIFNQQCTKFMQVKFSYLWRNFENFVWQKSDIFSEVSSFYIFKYIFCYANFLRKLQHKHFKCYSKILWNFTYRKVRGRSTKICILYRIMWNIIHWKYFANFFPIILWNSKWNL